jgi:hypothetical protein
LRHKHQAFRGFTSVRCSDQYASQVLTVATCINQGPVNSACAAEFAAEFAAAVDAAFVAGCAAACVTARAAAFAALAALAAFAAFAAFAAAAAAVTFFCLASRKA